jgi:ribonuclease-3
MDALATLGDAVIGLLVVDRLVSSGIHDKGELSALKAQRVNMSVLRRAAEEIGLKDYIRWGHGEERQEIWLSGRVLAEALEALIGAVFLDGGLSASENVLDRLGLLPPAH